MEVHGDFSNESLERKLSNEELGRFLEATDVSEGNSSGSESVSSLDADTSGGGGFTLGGLGSYALSGLFCAGSLSSGVLGASHCIYY